MRFLLSQDRSLQQARSSAEGNSVLGTNLYLEGFVIMRASTITLFLFALLVVSPIASGRQTDFQARLVRAEDTWRGQKLHRYEFTVRAWCFCGLIGNPMRFRVEDGKSTAIGVPLELVPVARA